MHRRVNIMKKPRKRSRFKSDAAELNYLNEMISYYVPDKTRSDEFRTLCGRFRTLLEKQGRDNGSIALQEHWILLYRMLGDTNKAIWHQEREIVLLERLLEIGSPISEINNAYLHERLVNLAGLYRLAGANKEAALVLDKARRL
jgi:hypothetical protein